MMTMNDFVVQHFFYKKTNKKLNRIMQVLEYLTERMDTMSIELDNLVQQVEETRTVEESVIVLLDGIKIQLETIIAELEAAEVDVTTLVKLRDDLDASEQALAAAVEAFTPPVEPPVEPEL